MPKLQLLTAYIHLAGERGNTVFRGPDNPITYPESLILAAVHGGEEHVHTLVSVGEVERDHVEEFDRLRERYGDIVRSAFPLVAGKVSLPLCDENLPTAEEMAAAKKAQEDAMSAAKAKRGKSKKAAAKTKPADEPADAAAVPSLDDLPK